MTSPKVFHKTLKGQEIWSVEYLSKSILISTFFISVENAELGQIETTIEENKTFDKLKGKSLGCPSNIMFWNDQQKQMERRIEKLNQEEEKEEKNKNHTLLIGDYGTGYFLAPTEAQEVTIFVRSFVRSSVRPVPVCLGLSIIIIWAVSGPS